MLKNRKLRIGNAASPLPIYRASESKVNYVTFSPNKEIEPRTVLVKFPTRQRPEKFLHCFDRWIDLRSKHHKVEFLVSIDHDDPATLVIADRIMERGLQNDLSVTVVIGHSTGKIHAVNRDLENREFDILIVASDDMWPQISGYDALIVEDMLHQFPALDGALHYFDGYRADICTLPVMGRELYKAWGYVYHPSYKSLWCDNEFTDVAKIQKKYWYSNVSIVRHEHPANSRGRADKLLIHNDSFFKVDRETYLRRKAAHFGMPRSTIAEWSKPYLSILIPTVPARAASLEWLLSVLRFQIKDPEAVEILTLLDDGEKTVGAKRQELLEQAKGCYVVYIDDDDAVSSDYIALLLKAIAEDPDCVTFDGEITTNGQNPLIFQFGLHLDDRTVSWGYERRPNHLCPIRASIAKQVPFMDMRFGEDANWSARVKPLLKTESRIDKVLYYYRFSSTGSLTTNPLPPSPAPSTTKAAAAVKPPRGIQWRKR